MGLSWQSTPHRILALGDRSQPAHDAVQALAPNFAIRILEAPRRADPRRYGFATDAGDWYVESDMGPDPHAFHLSLAALETSLLEVRDGAAVLFGVGQGAVLSLSLACCWSERLAAVVACGGNLPTLPAGGLLERPLSGLPILCVGASSASTKQLLARGACVTESALRDATGIATWLHEILR